MCALRQHRSPNLAMQRSPLLLPLLPAAARLAHSPMIRTTIGLSFALVPLLGPADVLASPAVRSWAASAAV